mgnify:CR=1 FL=1
MNKKILGNYPMKVGIKLSFPKLYCIKNPERTHWIMGWLTGIDQDLVCIFPNIRTRVMEHWTLSPVCSNRFWAFIAYIAKRLLFFIDENLQGLD